VREHVGGEPARTGDVRRIERHRHELSALGDHRDDVLAQAEVRVRLDERRRVEQLLARKIVRRIGHEAGRGRYDELDHRRSFPEQAALAEHVPGASVRAEPRVRIVDQRARLPGCEVREADELRHAMRLAARDRDPRHRRRTPVARTEQRPA
jgi:hypothetical protein